MSSYYIGFDSGTQGTKVAIYADDSTLVAEAFRAHQILYPKPGWAEMDANQFYRAAAEGIAECVTKSKVDPKEVKGISCSGIICGIVPVDKNWNATGPYMLYLDGRSAAEAEEISQNVQPLWVEESGNCEVGTYMPPVMLKWLLKHRPDLIAASRKVVTNSHFVMGKLGGFNSDEAYLDWGNLSGWIIGYDAAQRDWSQRQLDLLGLPRELLPKVVNPAKVVGTLCKEAANELGLREGIPLVAGSGDIMQSILGSGITDLGCCSDVAGTASIFTVNVDKMNKAITMRPGIVYSMSTLEDQYLYWGYIRAGGLSLGWFKEELMMRRDEDEFFQRMDKLAEEVPLGSKWSLFFPYLQGGDASLPNACGAWLGLFGSSNVGSMWRSVLEGIAFEYLSWVRLFREQGIDIKEVVCTGGGAKSPIWNQIKADVLNASYTTLKRGEGAVLGNALLAAYGVGDVKNLKETTGQWVEQKARYNPVGKHHEAYQAVYEKRKEILEGPMVEIFKHLAELRGEAAA
jgi:xylulokinase